MNKKQITNIEVKRNNRNRIFRYICKHDTVSNPDISHEVKMSLPTVTQNTKELIEKGLVEEVGEWQSTGGRRAKAMSIVANARQAVGLDITRNHIGLVLTNLTGEILKHDRIVLPYQHAVAYYCKVNEILEGFLDESAAKRENILGIGISFPGIMDLDREIITSSRVLDVTDVPFVDISRYFSYPCYFLNDANAGAYAEGIQSDSLEHFFFLSLSNSVGGALFEQKELVQGKNFRCGEVGHMTLVPDGGRCYCGKDGCMDVYCSAKCLSDITDGKLEQFFIKLDQEDTEIIKIWDKYTTYLAMAINNIHMVLDCDIILGGYVGSYMGEHIQDIKEKVVQRNTFEEDGAFVKICNYKLGTAALGAALKVIETFIEQV